MVPCLCNMPQDAGHAFCRCAMTFNAPMSFIFLGAMNMTRIVTFLINHSDTSNRTVLLSSEIVKY